MSETICKLCFKTLTTPEGLQRRSVRAADDARPRGQHLQRELPAPTFTVWTGIVGIDVVYKALAKGMPDRVPASSGGDLADIMLYGENPETGRPFVEANNEGVGWGAGVGHDGANALMHISETMVRNIPIEVFENKAPIRFDQLSLREDSGGPGEHRGGLGIRRDFRVLEPVGALSIIQKTRTDNWGWTAGSPGRRTWSS